MTRRLERAVLLVLWSFASVAFARIEPFWFVHITDTHIGVEKADERLSATLNDIRKNFPATEFVVNTGDLTEMGREDELTTYAQLMAAWPYPVYNALGNHDVRWSEWGKEKFRQLIGPNRFFFDHKGIRFFFLDTSMLAEHHGHFSKEDLTWLDRELGRLPAEMPAVVCFHHPPLLPASTIDNDTEFGQLMARHNVPLVLVGHGHTFWRYTLNGTTYCMGGSTSYSPRIGQPAYRAYYVDERGFLPFLRVVPRDLTTSETRIPLHRLADPYGELIIERQTRRQGTSLRLECRLTSSGRAQLTTGTFALDKAFTGRIRFDPYGRFSINAPDVGIGRHRLSVTFFDEKHSTFTRSRLFDITGPPNGPRLLRRFEMPSTIQTSPAIFRNIMYIGCNDGTFRAIDLVTSTTLWETKLGAEILSTPAATQGWIVVGCNDSNVYCFDAYTGRVRWKFKTGAAVLASPRIVDQVVYIGSGDGFLYALDVADGRCLWQFRAGRLIKSTPAYSQGRVYFGAWDNWFYCLDGRDGRLVWRVPVSTTPQFSAATASPVTTGTRVVFTSHDYCVRCLDQKTGAHLWMYKPAPEELGPSYSTFVLRGNKAYSTSIAGTVVGFDLISGKKVADIAVRPEKRDELFDSAPVMDGPYLYVGSTGGNVYCVDVEKGRTVWAYGLQPGFIFSSPVIWGDRLLVASSSGTVYELSRPEATQIPWLDRRKPSARAKTAPERERRP